MAPQRTTRKAIGKEKMAKEWKYGDLVTVKVKGNIAWPAKISRPEDWERMRDPWKCCVHFFGTNERAFVAPGDIKSLSKESRRSVSGGTGTFVLCATFEGMIRTLTRSKGGIKRATFFAYACAECGIASEIMELLIRKLETEPTFHHRVALFFLVDSITQGARMLKGVGASYIPIVQTSLPRLLEAAAPSVAGAGENRKQCLKVLQLWLDRKILPRHCLQHYVDYFRVINDDTCAGSFNRHPSEVERAVDDPLRQFDGMLVNEYGSNAGVSFKFSPKGRGTDGICQDFENSSAKRFSPPSPLDSPPPTPPLPSSPMPPPPRLSSPSPPPPSPPLQPHAYAPPPPLPAPSSQFTFLNKILQPPSQPVCPTFSQEGYFRPLEMSPANTVGVQPPVPSGPPPPIRWPPVGDVGFQPPYLSVLTSGPQPPLERPMAINVGFQPAFQVLPSAHPVSAQHSGPLMMLSTQGSSSFGSWGAA